MKALVGPEFPVREGIFFLVKRTEYYQWVHLSLPVVSSLPRPDGRPPPPPLRGGAAAGGPGVEGEGLENVSVHYFPVLRRDELNQSIRLGSSLSFIFSLETELKMGCLSA